jgi:hypothetical protein
MDVDEHLTSAAVKWLMEAEEAFEQFSVVFGHMADASVGPPSTEQALEFQDLARAFESQARHLRATLTHRRMPVASGW